ncbi:MAG: myo-inosose-2 dehydratase [Gammaproteobacteria bacterium]|nr:myo-inosose-2 dehydratase [Gammaproteobacteria bacterium]
MQCKLGIAPIAWWNDDLEELSDDVSLEECLRQANVAGFTGMETGRRFPMDMVELGPILDQYNISVCGGWFSGLLLDSDLESEKQRIHQQLDFFVAAGAPCIVYGETARSIQGDQSKPLSTKPRLTADEMKLYGEKMTAFAEWCEGEGMPIAYHHHMAAVIETESEIDAFLAASGDTLKLLYDAGHLYMAGGDLLGVLDKHHHRISHVHTKDIRQSVLDSLDRSKDSFLDAVVKGVFTVPGDGDLPFDSIIPKLASVGYEGWFVVEAEQDPKANPPLDMARTGHTELHRLLSAANYTIAQ